MSDANPNQMDGTNKDKTPKGVKLNGKKVTRHGLQAVETKTSKGHIKVITVVENTKK